MRQEDLNKQRRHKDRIPLKRRRQDNHDIEYEEITQDERMNYARSTSPSRQENEKETDLVVLLKDIEDLR